MAGCVFLGDEVSAAGFRLAGIAVYAPTAPEAPALFQALCDEAVLVLITAEVAAWVPGDLLQSRVAAERPLVLVLDDVRHRQGPEDLAGAIRRQLGMA